MIVLTCLTYLSVLQAALISLKQDIAEIRKDTSLILHKLNGGNDTSPVAILKEQDLTKQIDLKPLQSVQKTKKKRKPWPSRRVYEGKGYREVVVETPVAQ